MNFQIQLNALNSLILKLEAWWIAVLSKAQPLILKTNAPFYNSTLNYSNFEIRLIKILLFLEMRVTINFLLGRPQIYFFNWFSVDILFSSLVSFAFFDSYFFVCLFVTFWNQKCIFWYTFDCEGRWVINFYQANFRKQDYFFGLKMKNKQVSIMFCLTDLSNVFIFTNKSAFSALSQQMSREANSIPSFPLWIIKIK